MAEADAKIGQTISLELYQELLRLWKHADPNIPIPAAS